MAVIRVVVVKIMRRGGVFPGTDAAAAARADIIIVRALILAARIEEKPNDTMATAIAISVLSRPTCY